MPEALCAYCAAAPQRLELADALESGGYSQIPPADRLIGTLRTPDDRYSVTGVATSVLTNSVWVRTGRKWAAHPLDVFNQAFPAADYIPVEFPNPPQHFMRTLQQQAGPGRLAGCPEQTARALGIFHHVPHDPHETHDPKQARNNDVLWFRTDILTAEQKEACGIPEDCHIPYVLDTLDFAHAASLLRQYPTLLDGHCTCKAESQ